MRSDPVTTGDEAARLRPLVIAAPASGSGKTSVTLGLLAALRRRGRSVAPFKVGPDYIDPGHHAAAGGRASRNLDGWMCGEARVRKTFARGCRGADGAVVEGVMGLFDGAAGDHEAGSTAEIARWLEGRILLVLDARAQARSAAALALGFARFDPRLEFAGIVCNRVGSANHRALLEDAFASVPGLPPLLGCLPRDEDLTLPQRHLGLVTAGNGDDGRYERLADWVESHLDLDRLVPEVGGSEAGAFVAAQAGPPEPRAPVRIGVARDAAFCFYYPDNLELLEAAGARLVEFSPLGDRRLPEALDGLYLGGGYPELHAAELAANHTLLSDIREAAAAGLPIYAECGGLLLLAAGMDGYGFAGVFPGNGRLLPRRRALGYREVTLSADGPLGPAGTVARGHEFHYSELELPATVSRCYRVRRRDGTSLPDEGYALDNVLGSYIHLHFGSNPRLAEYFVDYCRRRRRGGK